MGKRSKKIKAELADLEAEYDHNQFTPKNYLRAMSYVYLNHIPDEKLEYLIALMKKIMKEP